MADRQPPTAAPRTIHDTTTATETSPCMPPVRTSLTHPPLAPPTTAESPADKLRRTAKSQSPRVRYESDSVVVAKLVQTGVLSGRLTRWLATYLRLQEYELGDAPALTPADQLALEALQSLKDIEFELSLPTTGGPRPKRKSLLEPPAPEPRDPRLRRSLSSGDKPSPPPPETTTSQSGAPALPPTTAPTPMTTPAPQPARDHRPRRVLPATLTPPAPAYTIAYANATTNVCPGNELASPAGDYLCRGRHPHHHLHGCPLHLYGCPLHLHGRPLQLGRAPTTSAAPTATQERDRRYPPLIVESLPNWPTHMRALHGRLGHAPNARPFGQGVRFSPADGNEYRQVQAYLTELESREGLHWYSYALSEERSIKVGIRGLPFNTQPEEIKAALGELGFNVEHVKQIRARAGRPRCIFFASIGRTQDTSPAAIYQVTELFSMPGVTIEAWRGKRGPAQCHRCQGFRHSSKGCHRALACVRCGDPHAAADCPRPRTDPPTCVNCSGPHAANNTTCPAFKREIRNRKAGPLAKTGPPTKAGPTTRASVPTTEVSEVTASNLMAPANPPTTRGDAPPHNRRRKKRGGRGAAPPPPGDASATTTNAANKPPPTNAPISTATQNTTVAPPTTTNLLTPEVITSLLHLLMEQLQQSHHQQPAHHSQH